jgi:hypothetical protein
MPSKTTHIIPKDSGWAVKKEGAAKRNSGVYATQKEAIELARGMTKKTSAGQIVVHGRDGSMRFLDVHGLPAVQTPRRKSDLGTKAIKKAVSAVIRERLSKENDG